MGRRKRKAPATQSSCEKSASTSGTRRTRTEKDSDVGQMSSSGARNISNSLCTALDKIGANQWMRQKYYELNVIQLTAYQIELPIGVSECYRTTIVGSCIEGTTTAGMGTDIDFIHIGPNNVVEQGFEGTIVADEKTVVVVTDNVLTPPGFVKLKVDVKCRIMPFKLQQDSDGHCFISNIYLDYYKQNWATLAQVGPEPLKLERHGPALKGRIEQFTKSHDSVYAFRSKSWLSFNLEFFNRTRHHGWPNQETLDIMKGQGCLLVPTGHHSCKEEHRILQWRISFSFQERHLMLNLNTTQYKCYMLLKLVKKYHISPTMDLTSYHCKTSLLYTIENTDVEIWKEDNILKCFVLCLEMIKKWSRKQMCPSYFIPEVNLFIGKIEIQELSKLTHILTNIIRRPQHYLQQISTDNFGKLVELYKNGSTDDENIEEKVDTQVADTLCILLLRTAYSILNIRSIILQNISYNCSCLDMAIKIHYEWLSTIQNLQTESKMEIYHLGHVLWALLHVCRFLHSSLASHLALKAVCRLNTQMKTWHILAVAYHFWMGLKSDAYSGKMKLATFLFSTGYLSSDSLKINYCSILETHSVCFCSRRVMEVVFAGRNLTTFRNLFKSNPTETLKMSTSVYIEKYVSACTIFLPTESDIVLYPLQFEMHRNFGSQPTEYHMFIQDHVSGNILELNNCATLDSKVYYVLLMIYLSGKEERASHITMLNNCVTDNKLKHRETTLNVLGWFLSSEEINQKSLMCYKISWIYNEKIQVIDPSASQPIDRNAAKWHMALLLYRAWFNKKLVK